jgi:predicted nucleic acid-binding protein
MSPILLFDSNILIYHFRGELNTRADELLRQGLAENGKYSIVSKIELLGYRQPDAAEEEIRRFMSQLVEVPLSPEIVEQAIVLRKAHRIKLPDAVIAASAIVLNATLITRDSQDFKPIKYLSWINPFDGGTLDD